MNKLNQKIKEIVMDEIFIRKVRAAAVAGWWTLLIAFCILLIQWFTYLFVMNRQPAGVLCLLGEGVTWPEIRTIWLWGMVAYKLVVAIIIFVVIWLTLWARQLTNKKA
jgi:hypothetical protein